MISLFSKNTKNAGGAVAQICLSGATGGPEKSAFRLARQFDADGSPSVCICRQGSALEDAAEKAGLPCLALNPAWYLSPVDSFLIRRWLNRHHVTTVFVHSLRDLWFLRPALIGFRPIQVILMAWKTPADEPRNDIAHRLIFAPVDTVVATSQVQKEVLEKRFALSPQRITVVPFGIDTVRFQPGRSALSLRQEWMVEPEDTLFGLVGRLSRPYGTLEFIEAAAKIAQRYDSAKFVLATSSRFDGDSSEFQQQVFRRINELNLQKRFYITNVRKNVPEIMNAIDVFCMPSHEEGRAQTLLAAMATARPCIATNQGGTPEILNHGEAGLLIPPRSTQALEQAMTQLMEQPSLRQEYGTRAYNRATQQFAHAIVFQTLRALIHKTTQSTPKSIDL